jgi:hypothetical protein
MTDDPQETQHESFRLPTNKEVPVWRYMDLAKYLMMLNSKSLYFARANKLGDPFEGSSTRAMVARREYIRANRTTDPNLASWKDVPDEIFTNLANFYKTAVQDYLVNCWHMNEHESVAMWRLYSTSHEAIAIRSTYHRLRECLPQCVRIGEVNYIDWDTEGFGASQAFNFIMHKQRSFEHERELRAVFWDKEPTPEAQDLKAGIEPTGLAIKVDLAALIERVYVSPTAAPWFASLVEATTKKIGYSLPLIHSGSAADPLY